MIEANIVAEGKRVLARAHDGHIPLRLLGGVAIYLRAPNGLFAPCGLQRPARAGAHAFLRRGA